MTAEKAREMQLLAAKKKHLNHHAKILAQAASILAPPNAEYQEVRLSRVRAQLDRLDEWIMEEKDPAKLDRLAAAQSRLAEQEQRLAMRPSPGSLRPAKRGPEKQTPASEPSAE